MYSNTNRNLQKKIGIFTVHSCVYLKKKKTTKGKKEESSEDKNSSDCIQMLFYFLCIFIGQVY